MSQLDQTRIRPPHADEGDDTEGHGYKREDEDDDVEGHGYKR